MALLHRLTKPVHCLGVILRHPLSNDVRDPEIVLSIGKTLLGRSAVPAHRLGITLRARRAPVAARRPTRPDDSPVLRV